MTSGSPPPGVEAFEPWLGGGGDDDGDGTIETSRRFRDVVGRFASGVTVVTALHEGSPIGLTCQSFASVSLDPPLVLFVPSRSSRAWPLIRASGGFCVNVLAADQAGIANTMASRGADKFREIAWRGSPATGSPVLAGVLGHLDCAVAQVHEAGDHDVVIGRVVDLAAGRHGKPLLFYRGHYRTTD